uniref:Delta-actitoxin-Avd2b 1 n=2 Tax=Anemonia viridis TaxID=51769 RepID=STX71_ANEVI|nr:RecName: Full=Delta-actitoxin-Avd2b 1; Short=Delta-AITX-Avd2b 1; AltName: Full=Av7; AltName: Full=Neurotoxin 7; Flags: Precursor [Anemonia viridis]ACL12306.1 neurotoxin 7 precursor [Anemonia viridis]ACL12307.1 neurotoxin 7 precursor [Anemonia viridis]
MMNRLLVFLMLGAAFMLVVSANDAYGDEPAFKDLNQGDESLGKRKSCCPCWLRGNCFWGQNCYPEGCSGPKV